MRTPSGSRHALFSTALLFLFGTGECRVAASCVDGVKYFTVVRFQVLTGKNMKMAARSFNHFKMADV
jgi:hypothetical protein